MVLTETSKVWGFLSELHLGLAGLVDTGIDGPESYANDVGRAIRQESWMKIEKKVNPSAGEGLIETTSISDTWESTRWWKIRVSV